MLFRESTRLARHTVVYGLGNIASRLVGFVLLPLYTRVIAGADLGALWALVAISGLLSTLLGLGMNSAIFSHYYGNVDTQAKRRVIATAFFTVTIASIVTLVPLWIAQPLVIPLLTGDAEYLPLLSLTLLTIFFNVGTVPGLALLRAEERSTHFALIGVGRFVLNLAVNAWFVAGLGLGAKGVLLGNLITVALLYTGFLPYLWGHLRAGLDRTLLRTLVTFGFPITIASLGAFVLDSSDLLILRWFRGLEEVGDYGIFYRIARIVQVVLVQPFVLAWPAIMWSVAGRPGAESLFGRILTYVTAVTAIVASAVAIFQTELVTFFATSDRMPAQPVLFVLAFAFVPYATQYVLNTGVSIERRTAYIARSVGWGVLVNVGLNLWLIPPFGMMGAAVATLVAYVTSAVAMAVYGQRVHPIPYEWRRIAWIGVTIPTLTFAVTVGTWPLWLRALSWLAIVGLVLNPWFLKRGELTRLKSLVRGSP